VYCHGDRRHQLLAVEKPKHEVSKIAVVENLYSTYIESWKIQWPNPNFDPGRIWSIEYNWRGQSLDFEDLHGWRKFGDREKIGHWRFWFIIEANRRSQCLEGKWQEGRKMLHVCKESYLETSEIFGAQSCLSPGPKISYLSGRLF
jgi:hypothetical protein